MTVATDHETIRQLLAGYLRGFDARRSDHAWLRSIFTDDVSVAFPIGAASGLDELRDAHRHAMALWGRTLHLIGNEVVTLDGDTAEIGATLHATHVHRDDDPGEPLHIGANVDAEAARTSEGWRLRKLAVDLVWSSGDGPSPAPG